MITCFRAQWFQGLVGYIRSAENYKMAAVKTVDGNNCLFRSE